MPVLYGVFLFMGISSLKGIQVRSRIPPECLSSPLIFPSILQMMQRVMVLFMPVKYQPDYIYLRKVPLRRVHLFTLIQIICLAVLWTIKSIKMISIVFPLMVRTLLKLLKPCLHCSMEIHVRFCHPQVLAMCFVRKGLDWVFTRHELKWLDDIIPESHKREKEDKKKYMPEVSSQHSCMGGESRRLDSLDR